jgi:replication factor C small subunit
MKQLLVDKYKPKTIDEMILDESIKSLLNDRVKTSSLPHLLFAGIQGIGKTTLAHVIANELGAEVLYINCGTHGSVDVMKSRVVEFCSAVSFEDSYKIVILDEAENLSSNSGKGSSAQDSLKGIIEDAQSDTRFILTCNNVHKIIEPVRSRCTPMHLKFEAKDILKRCKEILDKEDVSYSKDELTKFYNEIILKRFPDIRTIINTLELSIINNKFEVSNVADNPVTEIIINGIIKLCDKKNYRGARELWIKSEETFGRDYQELAGKFFERFDDEPMKQIKIASKLFEMSMVLDKEIQFYSMILELYND